MTIKSKIITIIALTVMLAVGATTAVFIRMQNNKMINAKFQETVFLSGIIERTIESSMREGNSAEVARIIDNIGKNREIVSLRIISPDGTILKSTNNGETGSRSAEFSKGNLEAGQKPRLLNETTINYFHRIENRAECHRCHEPRYPLIGLIQIKHDISGSLTTFLSLKRLLIFSNITIVILISVIISVLFTRLVMTPLNNLLSTINNVEAGNWHATVNISSNDELGIIGSSFNKMIREISSLYSKNIAKEGELQKIRVELEHKTKSRRLPIS